MRGGGGDLGQALTYVDALRQRAYGNTSGNIPAAQLNPQFILDERGRELSGKLAVAPTSFGMASSRAESTYSSWKGGSAAGTATDAHLNVFPIPATELVANPKLKQNANERTCVIPSARLCETHSGCPALFVAWSSGRINELEREWGELVRIAGEFLRMKSE